MSVTDPTDVSGWSNLAKALVAFQAELPTITKEANNPFFNSKYASLPQIVETIKPLMGKHKLGVTQMVGQTWMAPELPVDNLTTRLFHESGEYIEDCMMLRLDKLTPQAQGSAITYARRYALCAILGIVADVDDDGEGAETIHRANPGPTAAERAAQRAPRGQSAKDKLEALRQGAPPFVDPEGDSVMDPLNS